MGPQFGPNPSRRIRLRISFWGPQFGPHSSRSLRLPTGFWGPNSAPARPTAFFAFVFGSVLGASVRSPLAAYVLVFRVRVRFCKIFSNIFPFRILIFGHVQSVRPPQYCLKFSQVRRHRWGPKFRKSSFKIGVGVSFCSGFEFATQGTFLRNIIPFSLP